MDKNMRTVLCRSTSLYMRHYLQWPNYSMTSLSLPRIDVITLPMKNGVFLGISVLSHDGGIFVSEIYNGEFRMTTGTWTHK